MIPPDELNIWAQTRQSLFPLYEQRVRGLAGEMDCLAQAAELYAPFFEPSDRILDAGAAAGYFFRSLKNRGLLGRYWALDYTEAFLNLGRTILAEELPEGRFLHCALEEAPGRYEAVFCINALFTLPDYRQGLERLLAATEKIIILRSAFGPETVIRYEEDAYLDPSARGLKSYFNIWKLEEVLEFIRIRGFTAETPADRRSGDRPEVSAGKPFPWRFIRALRRPSRNVAGTSDFRR